MGFLIRVVLQVRRGVARGQHGQSYKVESINLER
jgi:hypothetical protein